MNVLTWRYLVPAGLLLFGAFFSWRLLSIPSRIETTAFMILFFLIPTLKYPKFGVYYLFCMPFFIPMFRRMYYLIESRPTVDYLLLISDGVMGGFICALLLLWLINKERAKDAFPLLIVAYTILLFVKVFVGNQLGVTEALYGFKFHGLYVMFFFAGSYIISTTAQTRRLLMLVSWIMLFTAVYAIKQILFGYTFFEQKWIDSITFTTLQIEGVIRPFSTYLSPATLSDGMVILLVSGLYWFVSKGRHMLLFGLVLAAASIWPLLIATVRTNWLAAIAGVGFYMVFLRIQKGWMKVLMMILVIGGVVGMTLRGGGGGSDQYAASAIQSQMNGNRNLSDIMIKNRTQALANPLQEYSLQKRMQTWGYIWVTTLKHPFGQGQGTTGYAHSFYFQILGESGFAGIALFLTILVMTYKRAFAVIRRTRDGPAREITRYLLTIIFMITILNLTGTHLHTPPGDLFFWFSLGTIHRFYRQMVDAEEAEASEAAAAAVQGAAVHTAAGSHADTTLGSPTGIAGSPA